MDAMDNVVVLGGGGREHALAWKLAQSPRVAEVFVLPGNFGMTALAGPSRFERKIQPVLIEAFDAASIIDFCKRQDVKLVVPGPDRVLVSGVAEGIANAGIPVFGPSVRAALITEGSKCDAKRFMRRYGIPTAPFRCFKLREALEAEVFIRNHPLPVVVKDDELAEGRGVTIAYTHEHALFTARQLLARNHFIVVEQYLPGVELSFTCIVVGNQYLPLAIARDHKTLGGMMTGGMGAVSADNLIRAPIYRQIIETIVEPTIQNLVKEDASFSGFLYFGLMIVDGIAYVLEINCRLGDPEAQAILPRLWSDLYVALQAALAGKLAEVELQWDPDPSVCVVLAAPGYPGEVKIGGRIRGIRATEHTGGVRLFSAAIAENAAGELIVASGRVVNVVGRGATVAEARERAYPAARKIRLAGRQMVETIGEGL